MTCKFFLLLRLGGGGGGGGGEGGGGGGGGGVGGGGRGHCGHDLMVVGYTTIYSIIQSAVITTDVVSSNPTYMHSATVLCDKVCQ